MNFRAIVAAIFCLAPVVSLSATTTLGPFQIQESGVICAPDVKFAIIQFSPDYKSFAIQNADCVKAAQGFPRTTENVWTFEGVFNSASGVFNLKERFAKTGTDEYAMSFELTSENPRPCVEFALLMTLPIDKFSGRSIDIDGAKTTFPSEFKELALANREFNQCALECQDLKMEISGESNGILVQDERAFGGPDYTIRFGFSPRAGTISKTTLRLVMKARIYETSPLDISPAFNFGFTDEVAGDGQGGWTDQGPENDLRTLMPGLKTLGGVKFDIVDPAKNGGRSCLVFGGDKIPGLANRASMNLPNVLMKRLCLLHALAWPPANKAKAGSVKVTYADGSSSSFPILNGIDVGNWWGPATLSNAQVVWTGENKSSFVGLYMTFFPLERKPVAKIELSNESSGIWMVVAAAAANDDIPRLSAVPFYSVENADWKPYPNYTQTEPGSALDFSTLGLQDAPAGKHGRVIVSNGHFAFAGQPSQPVRFYGTNLCFGMCFPDKAHAEKMASLIASCGYNAVRFHHFDDILADGSDPSKTKLLPPLLDRMLYLFKCLKNKGIYVTIDLYTIRKFKYEDRVVDISEAKTTMLLNEKAQDNLLQFSHNLLCARNPYTGLALKDDPALFAINMINEGSLFADSAVSSLSPRCKADYDKAFDQWLTNQGHAGASAAARQAFEAAFKTTLHTTAYNRMSLYLRGIGCKTLFTDQNYFNLPAMSMARAKYDYVDNHAYWAHPRFLEQSWDPPMNYDTDSSISKMGHVPALLFPTRLFGKPFVVTEFNFCFPNRYRAEGGALTGAGAALQDWDAIYRFGFAACEKQIDQDMPSGLFDSVNEPMQLMSDRLGVLLFLRGDVQPSSLKMPIAVSETAVYGGQDGRYTALMQSAGLVG